MLANELKERTSPVHTSLERKLLSHIQLVRDERQYIKLLTLMYGYYAALEERLEDFKHAIPDYDRRRKAQSIADDLIALGHQAETLKLATDLPEITSIPQAMGCMYVLEGSTLGGKIISKILLKQVPSLGHSMRFFQGYNDEAMEMWQKFKQCLDQIVTEDSHEEAQRAATETFVKFKNWIEQHDSNQL